MNTILLHWNGLPFFNQLKWNVFDAAGMNFWDFYSDSMEYRNKILDQQILTNMWREDFKEISYWTYNESFYKSHNICRNIQRDLYGKIFVGACYDDSLGINLYSWKMKQFWCCWNELFLNEDFKCNHLDSIKFILWKVIIMRIIIKNSRHFQDIPPTLSAYQLKLFFLLHSQTVHKLPNHLQVKYNLYFQTTSPTNQNKSYLDAYRYQSFNMVHRCSPED